MKYEMFRFTRRIEKKYIIMTLFWGVEIIYNTICNKQ